MAAWNEAKNIIRMNIGNFEVLKETQDMLFLDFVLSNGRHQAVAIELKKDTSGKIWIEITSPIGDVRNISNNALSAVLEMAEESICSGIIKRDELYLFRYAIPVDDLTGGKLIHPLRAILNIADMIEQVITGIDIY